jgi:ribosomal protein S18 acetylase RimI-like enzyme
LGIDAFLANLDALTGIYAVAMMAPAYQLPGRRAIMERHAGHTGFHAVAAILPPGTGLQGEGGRHAEGGAGLRANGGRHIEGDEGHRRSSGRLGAGGGLLGKSGGLWGNGEGGGHPAGGGAPYREAGGSTAGALVGFAYGFHGEAGQRWHDLVRDALAERHGRQAASDWMGDAFEVAEVHVHPEHQGHGTGHAMLLRLAAGRPEHTAMLSTMDADTSAHRLYRGVGFADLLPGFIFPGAVLPYTIMGAPLPLPRPCGQARQPGRESPRR